MEPKLRKNIWSALSNQESYQKRHLWWDARDAASPILEGLLKLKGVRQAEIAGSVRRKLETVGDLDFVAASKDPRPVMKWFTTQPTVEKILAVGETRASVRLTGGMQADLRVVTEEEYPFALCYFTGSKEHSIKLRERAQARGLSLNEYGFSPVKSKGSLPPSLTEEDLYKTLGLAFIPPELREDLGEFEAAEKKKLPHLITLSDIRGSFHNHTTASDGRSSLSEMIAGAKALGWEYLGISDHSKSSFQANGLHEERLLKQIDEIRGIKTKGITLFSGLECDILADGSLDFPEEVLKKLDYVIVSIHNSLKQDEKTMTKRLIRAIENPCTTFIGHLTGRILLQKESYPSTSQKSSTPALLMGKSSSSTATPNGSTWIGDTHKASDKGLLCCINADAHSAEQLKFVESGVNSARKGWLKKKHVVNTLPLKEIKKLLSKIHP